MLHRDSKIQDVGVVMSRILSAHHDVAGLEIPVHETLDMGRLYGVGDVTHDLYDLGGFHAFGGLIQGYTIDELHSNERFAVQFSDLVDLADMIVYHLGLKARFMDGSLEGFGTGATQQLEGHRSVELPVMSQVDLPHPAGADQPLNRIPTRRPGH